MKWLVIIALCVLAVVILAIFLRNGILTPKTSRVSVFEKHAVKTSMKLTSSAFEDNGQLPQKYSCEGEGINPPLEFSDVQKSAKSLALILEDPDAVGNPPFIHWVLFNISPNVKFIKEGSIPSNSQEGFNSAGKTGYLGACPPAGTGVHHYIFRLYALGEKLEDMPDFTDKDMLLEAINGHVLDQTVLTGLYQNSKDK